MDDLKCSQLRFEKQHEADGLHIRVMPRHVLPKGINHHPARVTKPNQGIKNMPKPLSEEDMGVGPCWKVRIHMRGMGSINVLSRTEPIVTRDANGWKVVDIMMEPINGTGYGDTIGFIDYADVSSVVWRKALTAEEEKKPGCGDEATMRGCVPQLWRRLHGSRGKAEKVSKP